MSSSSSSEVKDAEQDEELSDELQLIKSQHDIYEQLNENDSKDVNEEQANMFWEFIKQLRPGVNLYKISVPVATLEPKSLLERMSNYACPTMLILNVAKMKKPEQRFMTVLRWILSTLTTTPKEGIMASKPYNPILGEIYRCKYKHKGSTSSFYGEQVSHHPPITSFYMENLKKKIIYSGTLKPKTKMGLSNSLTNSFEGLITFHILNYDELYTIEFPPITARGLFFGHKYVEITSKLRITCKKTGYYSSVEFKSKKDNALDGKIKKDNHRIYLIKGKITKDITITPFKGDNKQDIPYLSASDIKYPKVIVTPVYKQGPTESRRVWHNVTYNIVKNKLDDAAEAKHTLEEKQRAIRKQRKSDFVFKPQFFQKTKAKEWKFIKYPDPSDYAPKK